MSSCEVPVIYVRQGMTPDELWAELRPLLGGQCGCDHGEDDPCCSETETPDEAAD